MPQDLGCSAWVVRAQPIFGRRPKWVRFMLPPKHQLEWERVPEDSTGNTGAS